MQGIMSAEEYFKKAPGNIADSYSDIQDNKLSLLTRLFDTEEDFFSTTKESVPTVSFFISLQSSKINKKN